MENRDGRRGDTPEQSVAVAEAVPSMSGAHWANRDNDTPFRRPARSAPFRRPPAENSFPADPVSPATDEHDPAPAGHGSPGSAGHRSPSSSGYEETSGFPATDGVANADLFGPDPDRFGRAGENVGKGTDRKSRHWTAIGTGTRRSKTAGREEARAPGGPVAGRGRPTLPFAPPSIPPIPKGRAGMKARKAAKAASAEAERDDTIGVLGGSGHEIRPHRAAGRPAVVVGGGKDNTGHGTATDAPRRSRLLLWATLATVFVVLLGGIAAVVVFSGRSGGLASVLRGATGSDDQRSVVAPLDGRTEASFELVTGTTEVTLRSEDLGNDLYRITTAEDAGTVPRPVVDENRVQLHLTPSGGGATGAVEIVLASGVKWALRFTGGAAEQRVDLSQGKVSGVDVVGGARRIELNLPVPAGTVPVRITGAVDEFVMTAPKNIPVRVRLDSGAKTVAAGERTQRDVPPGSTFTPRNWQVADRYDVDAASRVTLFSVEPKA
jgi:hypothetical protein